MMLRVTVQRMLLTPARLVLAVLSVLLLFCTLAWLQHHAGQVRERVLEAARFDGQPLYVLTPPLAGGGYHDLVSPSLDARVLAALSAGTHAGLWVLSGSPQIQVGDEDATRAQVIAVAINRAALAFDGTAQCAWVGGDDGAGAGAGQTVRFPSGAACTLVPAPARWNSVQRALDSRVLVVPAGLVEDVAGPQWSWGIGKALLSLPLQEADVVAAFARSGEPIAIATPGQAIMSAADTLHQQRLARGTRLLCWIGLGVSGLCLLLLLAGQWRLQARELGLLQLLGASPGQAAAVLFQDALLQAGLVSLPVLLLLPVLARAPQGSEMIPFCGAFIGLMAIVAMCYAGGALWRVQGTEPGALVRGELS